MSQKTILDWEKEMKAKFDEVRQFLFREDYREYAKKMSELLYEIDETVTGYPKETEEEE